MPKVPKIKEIFPLNISKIDQIPLQTGYRNFSSLCSHQAWPEGRTGMLEK
jgi:hypothetical protein